MRHVAAVVITAMLGSAGSASAEPPATWGVSTQLRAGSATTPFYTEALSETSSEFLARQIVFDGFYRLSSRLVIGARLPLALSSVRQPAGSYSANTALGNPELYVEDQSFSWAIAGSTVHTSARAGVGIPIAEHGSSSSLLQNRVVALSSALDGWRNPELYEPGVIPVTLSARAAILPAPWGASLTAKIPVLIRVTDASLPEESRTRAIGIVPHIEARGTWKPLAWFAVGVASHVVLLIPAAVSAPKGSARSGIVQWGVSPGLVFPIDENWVLSADFNAAVGGPLSGTYSIGLGIGFEL